MTEAMKTTPFESSGDLSELFTALCKCQGDLQGAEKTSTNDFLQGKPKYADLESVWNVCRGPLKDNGLSVISLPGETVVEDIQLGKDGNGKDRIFVLTKTKIRTVLAHTSGQWISCEMDILSERVGPQAIGIAVSYARRYMLAALLGIVQTDDDAEGATDRNRPSNPARSNNGSQSSGYVSDAQWKRLIAKGHSVADSHGETGDFEFVKKTILKAFVIYDIEPRVFDSKQLPKAKYDSVCDQVDKWVKKEEVAK